jgi:hypothetical protein
MKIFLSVPMKNKTKQEIEKTIEFMKDKAIEKFGYSGIEFINTIVEEKPPYSTNNEAIWYLGKSIELLAQCSVIICFKDLSPIYNGCIIEKEIGKRYGLQVVEL